MTALLEAIASLAVAFAPSAVADAPDDPCVSSVAGRQARQSCSYAPTSVCGDDTRNAVAPIQYVFVLMQENRSFDSYFGRFQDYLKGIVHRTDARVSKYAGQEGGAGVDVPGKPRELLDACHQAQQDAKLDDTYDPRVDAPFNPTVPGKNPPDKNSKHYWTHEQP